MGSPDTSIPHSSPTYTGGYEDVMAGRAVDPDTLRFSDGPSSGWGDAETAVADYFTLRNLL
ncbi:MAG: hypothetical protein U1C56_01455, partial [Candidatus Curtissbacteria bacterium]|nr:hypothetical protein [Candidatus Curtissbacteria bacterium]